jgi:hypothetical protein
VGEQLPEDYITGRFWVARRDYYGEGAERFHNRARRFLYNARDWEIAPIVRSLV